MSYISHINKYASSQAIQDALNAGTLKNPYVAMTPVGVLDYNTLEPAPVLKIAGQSITGTSAGGGVYEWNSLLNYSGTSFTIEVSNTPITAATWDYTEESLDQCGNPGTPVVATGTSMSVFEANSGYIEWASYSRAENLVSYGSMDDQTSDDPADICECQSLCYDEGTGECVECEEPTDCSYCAEIENDYWAAQCQECCQNGGTWIDDGSDSHCEGWTPEPDCGCSELSDDWAAQCQECCENGGTWIDDGSDSYCDYGEGGE